MKTGKKVPIKLIEIHENKDPNKAVQLKKEHDEIIRNIKELDAKYDKLIEQLR